MRLNYIVSFPRSGHHGLMGFLDKICGAGSHYCEFYTCKSYDGTPIACPKSDNKWQEKKFLCEAGKTNLKCHDFNLQLPYTPENKYLVQIRHPFLSIESWYEMELRKNIELPTWPEFLASKLEFWINFVQKWIVDLGDNKNVYVLRYNEISQLNTLQSVVEFLGYKHQANFGNLHSDYFNEKRNKLKRHDPSLYEIQESISGYLAKAGLKPLEI